MVVFCCRCRRKCFSTIEDGEKLQIFSIKPSKKYHRFQKKVANFKKKNMLSVETMGQNFSRQNKVTLKISKYYHFFHSQERKGMVCAKPYINSFVADTFLLRNSNSTDLVLPSKRAYPNGKIPINKNKMTDLLKLQTYLPQCNRIQNFYKKIYKWPVTDKDNTENLKEDN